MIWISGLPTDNYLLLLYKSIQLRQVICCPRSASAEIAEPARAKHNRRRFGGSFEVWEGVAWTFVIIGFSLLFVILISSVTIVSYLVQLLYTIVHGWGKFIHGCFFMWAMVLTTTLWLCYRMWSFVWYLFVLSEKKVLVYLLFLFHLYNFKDDVKGLISLFQILKFRPRPPNEWSLT